MPDDVEERHRPRNPGHFGPAVIGEDQFEKEKEIVEKGAHVFGPAVIDAHPATDEEGEKVEPDRSQSPTATVGGESAEAQVGQGPTPTWGPTGSSSRSSTTPRASGGGRTTPAASSATSSRRPRPDRRPARSSRTRRSVRR